MSWIRIVMVKEDPLKSIVVVEVVPAKHRVSLYAMMMSNWLMINRPDQALT
jgi:hypothetical protein